MKRCNACFEVKPLNEFGLRVLTKDGYNNKCKECCKLYHREYRKLGYVKEYYKEIKANKFKGVKYSFSRYLNCKYNAILARLNNSKNYKNRKCLFSRKEFILYALNNGNFRDKYNEWKNNGFDKKMRPNLDRIDNMGDYSLDNIQFLNHNEHWDKTHQERRNKKQLYAFTRK